MRLCSRLLRPLGGLLAMGLPLMHAAAADPMPGQAAVRFLAIGLATSHGKLPDVAALRNLLQVARPAQADGIIFFTWEALRGFLPEPGEAIRQGQPLPTSLTP